LPAVSLTLSLGPLRALRVGGLPLSLPGSPQLFLDGANGGGVVSQGTIDLPLMKKLSSSATLALGF
jgi:hypothetical protein